MLVFQVPPRTVKFRGGPLPIFPAATLIHAELGPKELFGEATLTGRLTLKPGGHRVALSAEMSRGGISSGSGGRLPTLEVEGPFFDAKLNIKGNVATVEVAPASEALFRECVVLVADHLPALLSNAMQAPVEVIEVYGTVADQFFQVQVTGKFETVVKVPDLPEAIRRSMTRVTRLPKEVAAKVFAAHRYALQARRLAYASEYATQFVGERLLNLNKAVEILFGRDVDRMRQSLVDLGVRSEVIEVLAALRYVRDSIDVGHPASRPLTPKQFEDVHGFVFAIEEIVTWLLDFVVEAFADERLSLPHAKKKSERDRTLARLGEVVGKVKALRPDTFTVP